MMIQKLVEALQAKDYKAMASCFAEECRLFDYCPLRIKNENYYIYGRWAVEMFYHNKFILGGLSFLDPRIQDERTINLYISYGGQVNHALATVESWEPETGLIRELVIRPA